MLEGEKCGAKTEIGHAAQHLYLIKKPSYCFKWTTVGNPFSAVGISTCPFVSNSQGSSSLFVLATVPFLSLLF